MIYKITNECIETLTTRKKDINKVCGIIGGICAALFIASCLLTNTFFSSLIIKAIILGIAATDLCYFIASNIVYDNAITEEKMAQAKKMLESGEYNDEYEAIHDIKKTKNVSKPTPSEISQVDTTLLDKNNKSINKTQYGTNSLNTTEEATSKQEDVLIAEHENAFE